MAASPSRWNCSHQLDGPLQRTRDLKGFWQGSYQEVRREMRGRYPKHPWPDDPRQALPTIPDETQIQRKATMSHEINAPSRSG